MDFYFLFRPRAVRFTIPRERVDGIRRGGIGKGRRRVSDSVGRLIRPVVVVVVGRLRGDRRLCDAGGRKNQSGARGVELSV